MMKPKGIQTILKDGSFDGFLGQDTVKFDDFGDRQLSPNLNLGGLVEVSMP